MKRLLVGLGALLILGVSVPAAANAQLVTFDDYMCPQDPDYRFITDPYMGFNWDAFGVLNTSIYSLNPSGYQNGVVSGVCVGYNIGASIATIAASPFTFNSGYFTAAWNDGLNLEVTGYLGATQLYQSTHTLNTSGSLFLSFGWAGIDRVTFQSWGGTDNPELPGAGQHFAVDNMAFNNVPEPASMVLLLTGLGAVVGVGMRRRKTAD